LMKRADFEEHLGAENICPNIAAALERAEQLFNHFNGQRRLRSVPELPQQLDRHLV
jgi:hypothetical protein